MKNLIFFIALFLAVSCVKESQSKTTEVQGEFVERNGKMYKTVHPTIVDTLPEGAVLAWRSEIDLEQRLCGAGIYLIEGWYTIQGDTYIRHKCSTYHGAHNYWSVPDNDSLPQYAEIQFYFSHPDGHFTHNYWSAIRYQPSPYCSWVEDYIRYDDVFCDKITYDFIAEFYAPGALHAAPTLQESENGSMYILTKHPGTHCH